MTPRIPIVEVAGHRNEFGIGRPDREANSGDAVDLVEMRAEGVPGFLQGAFAVQMQIEFRDDGREAVRIVDHGRAAVPVLDLDAIIRVLAF